MATERIKKIAKKMWNLEQKCNKSNDVSRYEEKMLSIAKELSLQDLLEIDEYIMNNLAK